MMPPHRIRICLTLLSLVLILLAVPQQVSAIPYFARKYNTTCARCHTAFPKLNVFGRNFQLHGYQQPGDQEVGKISVPEDSNLALIEQAPIAILLENQMDFDKLVGNSAPPNLNSPGAFHILASDTVSPDIGVFAELVSRNSVTSVGKVSLSFNHLWNQNIHLQVGNLDVQEHGVTEHDLFSSAQFPVQDLDIGGWQASPQHEGFRLYGLIGSSVTASLIHGAEGKSDKPTVPNQPAGAEHGPMVAPQAQQKQSKDDAFEDEADPMDKLTGFLWEVGAYNGNVNNNITNNLGTGAGIGDLSGRLNAYFHGDSFVGLVGYSGNTDNGTGGLNHYQVGGVDFSMHFGKPFERAKGLKQRPFELLGNFLTGTASNPFDTGLKASWNGFFVEGDYVLGAKAIALVRYSKVTSNSLDQLQTFRANSALIPETLTFNYTYYLRTNFFVGAEYTRDLTKSNMSNLGMLFDLAF